MKSKQLANVLIKMLGLSICLYAIPGAASGVLYAISLSMKQNPKEDTTMWMVSSGMGGIIQIVVGIIIIAMSQTIAGWMFKSEE